jgi:hypothetical protein
MAPGRRFTSPRISRRAGGSVPSGIVSQEARREEEVARSAIIPAMIGRTLSHYRIVEKLGSMKQEALRLEADATAPDLVVARALAENK